MINWFKKKKKKKGGLHALILPYYQEGIKVVI